MKKPICVKCGIEFRPLRNGVLVRELLTNGDTYAIWHADLYHCKKCGTEIIHGFGGNPIARVHEKEKMEQAELEFQDLCEKQKWEMTSGRAFNWYERVSDSRG